MPAEAGISAGRAVTIGSKRIPLVPTLVVTAAVALMIGLGVWQLQRARWKEALIAEIESSGAYRPISLACAINGKPEVRAGRSVEGESGYRYLIPCRRKAAAGDQVDIVDDVIDIGWSKRPDLLPHVSESRTFTGVYAAGEANRILILDEPIPPLEKSALPSAADLPNNHLLYAIQWFFFAFAAAVIYALALRRRQRRELPGRA